MEQESIAFYNQSKMANELEIKIKFNQMVKSKFLNRLHTKLLKLPNGHFYDSDYGRFIRAALDENPSLWDRNYIAL